MKNTARVLVTAKCNKDCSYCCNKKPGVLESAKVVQDLKFLAEYHNLCISGGEPMLYPGMVMNLIREADDLGLDIYLYTAQYTRHMHDMLIYLSGMTYTVHAAAGKKEIRDFLNMQKLLETGSSVAWANWKLLIDARIRDQIRQDIKEDLWNEIEIVSEWKDDCKIPENEDFFWYQPVQQRVGLVHLGHRLSALT